MSDTPEYIKDIESNLILAIKSKNPQEVYNKLKQLNDKILSDKFVGYWLVTPAVITNIHALLMEYLDIPDRLLLLRNRVPNPHRRAIMFNTIMIAALKKVYDEKLV
jgi:hypothetical protein